MLITPSSLSNLFTGYKANYQRGFTSAASFYKQLAMTIPSSTESETYGFLNQFPKLREWIGDRIYLNLGASGFIIKNRKWEMTITVPREKVEDDQYGIFGPTFEEMGKSAAEHPDLLVGGLLKSGFGSVCYDGQYFFDTDHPVKVGDSVTSVSNYQAGASEAWYLLDTSRPIKPFIFQERMPYKLTALDQEGDERVFNRDDYTYGVRARANAGYGLWQLAFASKAALTADNYELARKAMMTMTGDEGRPLGIKPDTLVVSPNLEGDAMRLLNNGTRIVISGATPVAMTNEWAGTAKPIVTQWVG